jgi:glutathione S-transferase
MADFTLVIGNQNYSSWSLRPWLVMKHLGADFDEVVIPLYRPESKEKILAWSPSGKVPALVHHGLVVWESLAICEYLAELFPDAHLWPSDREARAFARSISAEMHAGFRELRQNMPMDIRASHPGRSVEPHVRADIDRITAIWRECRSRHGSDGPFLFGNFTIADAMYAPVVSRFETYGVKVDSVGEEYCREIWAIPAMQEWRSAARSEPWTIEFD